MAAQAVADTPHSRPGLAEHAAFLPTAGLPRNFRAPSGESFFLYLYAARSVVVVVFLCGHATQGCRCRTRRSDRSCSSDCPARRRRCPSPPSPPCCGRWRGGSCRLRRCHRRNTRLVGFPGSRVKSEIASPTGSTRRFRRVRGLLRPAALHHQSMRSIVFFESIYRFTRLALRDQIQSLGRTGAMPWSRMAPQHLGM